MKALFGKTIDMLATALDFRASRHKVISSNIANLDTPGYAPSDISFPEALAERTVPAGSVVVMRTNERHLSGAARTGGANYHAQQTGQKVALDNEMVNLAENHLMYNVTVDLLARKFRSLNNVLKETK